MKNNLINKFILIFSIFLFLLFTFINNSFCNEIITITKYDPGRGTNIDYPIYKDKNLNNSFAIDKFYSTYVTVERTGIYYLLIVGQPETLRISTSNSNVVVNGSGKQLTVRGYVYDDDNDVYFPIGNYSSVSTFEYDHLIYNVSDLYYTDGTLFKSASDDSIFLETVEEEPNKEDNSSWFQKVIDGITDLPGKILDNLKSIFKDITDFLRNIWNSLDYINPFSENFILKGIIDWLNPFSDNFLGKKIIELFEDLFKFLFIPSNERLSAIQNTVMSKFDFVESIKIAINSFKDIINNLGNAPVIHLDLASTKYTNAMKINVIDLNWYKPYKQYGDVVITGLFYGFYLFRLFSRLPSIVNGAGSGASDVINISNYTGGGKK